MPDILGPPVSAIFTRLSHAPHSTINLMRCSGPQPSRDTTQPIAAIRISSALSDIVGGDDCNTPARRVTSRGVTGRGHQSGCHRSGSPIGVTGRGGVSPVGVTGCGHQSGCHRPGSPIGVTSRSVTDRDHQSGSPVGVTDRGHQSGCHRSGSSVGVTGLGDRSGSPDGVSPVGVSPVGVTGWCISLLRIFHGCLRILSVPKSDT